MNGDLHNSPYRSVTLQERDASSWKTKKRSSPPPTGSAIFCASEPPLKLKRPSPHHTPSHPLIVFCKLDRPPPPGSAPRRRAPALSSPHQRRTSGAGAPDIVHTLHQSYLTNAARNMRLYHELAQVLSLFNEHYIPVIMFKGAYLAGSHA